MASRKNNPKTEALGDFQTPPSLAARVCKLLAAHGLAPAALVEPSCGIGNFLLAALDQFPQAATALGVEINPAHVSRVNALLGTRPDARKVRILEESFFDLSWDSLLRDLPEPILVLGNPPWVTNARLGVLGSTNLPEKKNFQNHTGLAAKTGKSNFDISEWMLIRLLELLQGRRATLAMLCKTTVARRALGHAWKTGLHLADAEIRAIDAAALFDATVDACLLLCSLAPAGSVRDCRVYRDLGAESPTAVIGYHDGMLIADTAAYFRRRHLLGTEAYRWRSGIKHDCSRVMELWKEGDRFRNGLGQLVDLEDRYLYPMLKSSELANGRAGAPRRWMLVPQRAVADDTQEIRKRAPKTWQYLQEHGEALDRRASSIYRNRPRFAVFGVGEYSFAPWKVAVSGFYKDLRFRTVGRHAGKPMVLDDTAYFVACQTEAEARYVASLLGSEAAREFYSALIFWDAKRPITVEVLRRLDLVALGREMGTEATLAGFLKQRGPGESPDGRSLFDER
jgi:hypothetical protein